MNLVIKMSKYRLHFMVADRVEGAQSFEAETDAAAVAFLEQRRRGRAATVSGACGVIRRYGLDAEPLFQLSYARR